MELTKSHTVAPTQTSAPKDVHNFFSFNSIASPEVPFFQPKLSINVPGDAYEQQADAVAEQVMASPIGATVQPVSITGNINSAVQKDDNGPREEPQDPLTDGLSAVGENLMENNPLFPPFLDKLKLKLWDQQPAELRYGIIGFGIADALMVGTAFALDPNFRGSSIRALDGVNLMTPIRLIPHADLFTPSSFTYHLPAPGHPSYEFNGEFDLTPYFDLLHQHNAAFPHISPHFGLNLDYNPTTRSMRIVGGTFNLDLFNKAIILSGGVNQFFNADPQKFMPQNPMESPVTSMLSLPSERIRDTRFSLTFDVPRLVNFIRGEPTRLDRKVDDNEKENDIQRKELDEKEPLDLQPHNEINEVVISRKETANTTESNATQTVEQALATPGNALEDEPKDFMEERFQYDFSNVKIHDDSKAHQSASDINARAYTHQNHIVFGEGQYNPSSDDGKKLLAHELTHVVQQEAMNGNRLQRKVTLGEPEITSFLGTRINASENISRLKQIITNLDRILILTGNQLVVYNAADNKVVGNYTVNNVVLPPFYYISIADGSFAIAAINETSGQKGGQVVTEKNFVFYGKNNLPSSDDEKQIIATMDEQLTITKWFLNDKDRQAFYKDMDGQIMALAVTPLSQMTAASSTGEENEIPPILSWMPAWQKEMNVLITGTRNKDTVSTDIPEVFKFYYSKTKVRWRALANLTFEKKKVEIYLDVNEQDDKVKKLSLIRDKLRIRQLSSDEPAPRSKDSLDLEEDLTWAYRIKKELDLKIATERKDHNTSAEIPDSTAIVTFDDQPGKAFLKLSLYVIEAIPENTPGPEGKATSVLKTGVLPQPLPHPAPEQIKETVDQLFEIVKKATLSLRGAEFKANTSNPAKAETILEPFPAAIGVIGGREDFKTVTGATLETHMVLNMGVVEGPNTLHQTTIAYRGIYYTWDIYRMNDILTDDEKKTLDSDWKKQRSQVTALLKNSARMKAVNPVINEAKLKELNETLKFVELPQIDNSKAVNPEDLKYLRKNEISYGSATKKFTPDATFTIPATADDYVIYCRALVDPDDKVYRLPSEAFYPIKVLDGNTLADESRDANLAEINDLGKQAAATEDENKKKEITQKIEDIKAREKLTLGKRTAADIVEVERTKRLANRLTVLYKANIGKKKSLTADIANEPVADVNDLFQLWYTIETTNPGTPQIDKLQKMIVQLDAQVKGLKALQSNISDFRENMAGYTEAVFTPVTALVSKVTGEVYNLITMLAVKKTASGGTEVILVDVTSHQTQGKYYGSSTKAKDDGGLEDAIKNAYHNFGEECKYGEGYIAYRIPDTDINDHALSKPGFKQKVIEWLGYIAMGAGIAALVLGTIVTGGALGVAAFALGIGAGVIGAGLAIHNIYDRATNHRLEADVELAMDILNIVGPILQGLSALSKVAKLSQAAKLGQAIKAGTAMEESAETIASVAKLHRLVQIQKAFAIIQKGEAITNLSLVGYKTFKDLAAISEAYANDPKKRTAMEWEVLKNAALAGTIALVALRNEFKPTTAHMNEMEQLVNSGYKEKKYLELMKKSGLFDAEGKWLDPTLKSIDENSTKQENDLPKEKKVSDQEVKKPDSDADKIDNKTKAVDEDPALKADEKIKPDTPQTDTADNTPKPNDIPAEPVVSENVAPSATKKTSKKSKEKIAALEIDKPFTQADGSVATLKADGSIVIISKAGKGKGRKGFEKRLLSGIKVGLKGWHRAHSQGQGTGSESAHGIFYAPPEVNLSYQNSGIEARIRELFRITPPQFELTLTTVTKPHPNADGMPSQRLASIEYRIEISEPGNPRKFIVLEAGLKIQDSINNPKVEMSVESFGADALWSIRYGDGTQLNMSAGEFAKLKNKATALEKQLNELIGRLEQKLKTSTGDQKKIDQFHFERFNELRDSLYEHPDMVSTIRAEMDEAALLYPKEPLISADANSYLNQWRFKVNRGSKEHIIRLLELSGSWKDLIKKLQADPKANKTTLKVLERFRNAEVKRLKKSYNADTLADATTNPESDVDLNLKGTDAGANLIKAEAQMKEEFGENWSKMLRLNFYTEGDRLLRYTTEKMSPEALMAFEKEITRKTIQFSLAKMFQHAKATPEGTERVNTMIDLLAPQDAIAVKSLAEMDAATMLQKRNQLHGEVDALQKELAELAPGDPARIEKTKLVTMKQMKINFYSMEAYIGPGALMQTGAVIHSPALKMQKVMGNLEMMEHILQKANGNIVKAMKEYEMYKYMYRISDAINAKQMDLFFDELNKQISKINRQGAESMTPGQLENLYFDFNKMVNDYLSKEVKHAM